MNKYAYATFCDDVRNEVGNKFSLMGIYNGLMYLGEIPAFIPRLGVAIKFCLPIDEKISSLVFKILSSAQEAPIVEMEISPKDLVETQANALVVPSAEPIDEAHKRQEVGFMSALPPIQVTQETTIRAIVIADGVEYLAGRLHIMQAPKEQPNAQGAPS